MSPIFVFIFGSRWWLLSCCLNCNIVIRFSAGFLLPVLFDFCETGFLQFIFIFGANTGQKVSLYCHICDPPVKFLTIVQFAFFNIYQSYKDSTSVGGGRVEAGPGGGDLLRPPYTDWFYHCTSINVFCLVVCLFVNILVFFLHYTTDLEFTFL